MPVKITFIKLTLKTFKGVQIALKVIASGNITFIFKKKLLTDNIWAPYENFTFSIAKTIISNYHKRISTNDSVYKFYIPSIIYNSVLHFKKNLSTLSINKINQNLKTIFPIRWYTKIHNSIVNSSKNNIILYLRAARHFNKGRYSRNRQLYRTGVYWCIWLNVVIVYGLHFYFYRVTFAFGYMWFPLGLMILTIFSSRLYKYRYYNINQLKIEFYEYSKFLYYNFLKFKLFYHSILISLPNSVKLFFKNYAYLLYKFIESKVITLFNIFKKIFNL